MTGVITDRTDGAVAVKYRVREHDSYYENRFRLTESLKDSLQSESAVEVSYLPDSPRNAMIGADGYRKGLNREGIAYGAAALVFGLILVVFGLKRKRSPVTS